MWDKTQTFALEHIRPPRFKLRDDIGDLTELKASLQAQGLLIPIMLRATGDEKWEVVAGHRRYVAAKELGWETIPAVVVDVKDDEDAYIVALIENLLRKDLTALEEGTAFKHYIRDYKYGDISRLSGKLGLSPSHISHRISLLGLPESLLWSVRRGEITPSHGEELARLEDPEQQAELVEMTKNVGLSVVDLGKVVTHVKSGFPITQAVKTVLDFPDWEPEKEHEAFEAAPYARKQIVLTLEQGLKRVDIELSALESFEEEHAKWVKDVRYPLHEVVGAAMRLRKECG